jgi:general secretion pathway protein G
MFTNSQVSRRRPAAFSLIELLLVLVILGVLMMVVVPKFAGRSEEARKTAAGTDISMLEGQLDIFEQDCGRYPTNDEGLAALVQTPANAPKWKGPYIKRGVPNDPWGNPYVYRYPGTHNPTSYDLFSTGPDGREGNDDIDNWSAHGAAK